MSDNDVSFAVKTLDESTAPVENITGSYDALIAELKQLNQSADVTNHYMESLGESTEKTASKNESTTASLSELNQGFELIQKTVRYAGEAYDATVGKAQAYAETIRDLSQISGQGAESTSRFVQVLDDFQIGADDVGTAMRVMTKNGLVPNFETIKDLAKQYQEIQDPLAKNEFLVKNLGRASAGYTNLLSQNTDELQRNFETVDKKLIQTEEDQRKSEELRLIQDKLKDSVDALAISFGKDLLPAVTGVVNFLQGGIDGWNTITDSVGRFNDINLKEIEILKSQGLANAWLSGTETGLTSATDAQIQSAHDLAIKQLELTDSTKETVKSFGPYKPTAEDVAAANKAMSDSFVSIMGIQGQIVSQQNSFAASSAALATQQADVSAKLQEALAQGWWPTSDKVVQLRQQYDDLGVKAQDLAAKNTAAMAQISASAADAKFATDGWTAAEFNASEQIKVGLGLITQAQADAAVKTNDLAAAVANGQITVDQYVQAVKTGSLEVSNTNDQSGKSWEVYAGLVKEKVDTTVSKIDEGVTKTTNYANVTKSQTESVSDSWSNAAASISTNINDGIGNIQRYIDELNSIPLNINTTITQTITPPPGTLASQGVGGGVTIIGGTFYVDANSQVSQISQASAMVV